MPVPLEALCSVEAYWNYTVRKSGRAYWRLRIPQLSGRGFMTDENKTAKDGKPVSQVFALERR